MNSGRWSKWAERHPAFGFVYHGHFVSLQVSLSDLALRILVLEKLSGFDPFPVAVGARLAVDDGFKQRATRNEGTNGKINSQITRPKNVDLVDQGSRKEFEEMATRGRLHTSSEGDVIPSDSELDRAQSPLDLGRLYRYSEDDIAHYYWSRRRDCQIAYTEYERDFEDAKLVARPAAPHLK